MEINKEEEKCKWNALTILNIIMVTCINTALYHNITNLPGNIQYKCTQGEKYIKTPPTNTNIPQDTNTTTNTETNTKSQT